MKDNDWKRFFFYQKDVDKITGYICELQTVHQAGHDGFNYFIMICSVEWLHIAREKCSIYR